MTNELATLILAIMWLKTGRGVNLCLVILVYYIIFIASVHLRLAAPDYSQPLNVYLVYLKQSSIDLTILILCLALSIKYKKIVSFYGVYAAIIATSLFCNAMMLIDQAADLNAFYQWHKWRQQVAIPIDLIFAILGCGSDRIPNYYNPYLPISPRKRYNRGHCYYSLDRD